jgi:hypothetical protein
VVLDIDGSHNEKVLSLEFKHTEIFCVLFTEIHSVLRAVLTGAAFYKTVHCTAVSTLLHTLNHDTNKCQDHMSQKMFP